MLFHKHLLVNAKVDKPMKDPDDAIFFLKDLVNRIDMKIIKGPFAKYVSNPGNEGLTAFVMIETSHVAFHIWDQPTPGILQFDLYTCGSLDLDKVLEIMQEHFSLVSMDYQLFDREVGFVLEQQGSLEF